jgi:hypothetical protein
LSFEMIIGDDVGFFSAPGDMRDLFFPALQFLGFVEVVVAILLMTANRAFPILSRDLGTNLGTINRAKAYFNVRQRDSECR